MQSTPEDPPRYMVTAEVMGGGVSYWAWEVVPEGSEEEPGDREYFSRYQGRDWRRIRDPARGYPIIEEVAPHLSAGRGRRPPGEALIIDDHDPQGMRWIQEAKRLEEELEKHRARRPQWQMFLEKEVFR